MLSLPMSFQPSLPNLKPQGNSSCVSSLFSPGGSGGEGEHKIAYVTFLLGITFLTVSRDQLLRAGSH